MHQIVDDWGFEGVKVDFWSQNFEDRNAVVRNPGATGITAMRTYFGTLRKHLPPHGTIMTCIAMGMGNPFLGDLCDTYRATPDVDDGIWNRQWNNAFWALPAVLRPGSASWLLNMDSAGWNPELPDHLNQFRFDWCFVTMGMQEIGGYIAKWPVAWQERLRRYTDRCDRGHRVRCPDENAYTGIPLPRCLVCDYPAGSPTREAGIAHTVAFFNWSDEETIVTIPRQRIADGTLRVRGFWDKTQETWADNLVQCRLPPRSSRLVDILA
jgi:hypothetical protein